MYGIERRILIKDLVAFINDASNHHRLIEILADYGIRGVVVEKYSEPFKSSVTFKELLSWRRHFGDAQCGFQ